MDIDTCSEIEHQIARIKDMLLMLPKRQAIVIRDQLHLIEAAISDEKAGCFRKVFVFDPKRNEFEG